MNGYLTGANRIFSRDSEGNHMPYDIPNSVACCHHCNRLKGCLDPLTLRERAIHITRVQDGQPGGHDHAWLPSKPSTYAQVRYRARYVLKKVNGKRKWVRREVPLPLLTEDQFRQKTALPCIYCGRRGCNGLDQRVPGAGYSWENTPSLLHGVECNLMKKALSREHFIRLIRLIAANEAAILELAMKSAEQPRCRKVIHNAGTLSASRLLLTLG